MTFNANRFQTFVVGNYNFSTTGGARANVPLNVAYVHGVSGTAGAIRFQARTADPIDELYVMLDANTGTLGNITMACDIYNEHASSSTQPGPTLRASATAVAMPAAVDRWIKFTFGTPYTPAVGESIWLVFYNTAAAPATDFPNIVSGTNGPGVSPSANSALMVTTTAGFSLGGTVQVEGPFFVKQGANYYGEPTTVAISTGFTSNALKRGLLITPPVNMNIIGVIMREGSTVYTGLQVIAGADGPGDTPLASFAFGTDANQSRDEVYGSKIFATPFNMVAGSSYRWVFTVGVASQLPGGSSTEDYASYPDPLDALIDNFTTCASIQDNGAGGWTQNNAFRPGFGLIVGGLS